MCVKNPLLILAGFCLLVFSGFGFVPKKTEAGLRLTVNTEEKSYKLGEVVTLTFELKNENADEVSIGDIFGVTTGFLSVYTSADGKDYQKYNNPGWGLLDLENAPVTRIGPGKSLKATATMLWDWKGDDRAEFLFRNGGKYFVKATYLASISNSEKPILIESEPVAISLEEPKEQDLEIWKQMKDNADFAYFLQNGDIRIPPYRTKERSAFESQVQSLIDRYPDSSYSGPLRRSMSKFKATEARRKQSAEKLKPSE